MIEQINKYNHIYIPLKNLPSSPIFSPHLWAIWIVGCKLITVITIACVYLETKYI